MAERLASRHASASEVVRGLRLATRGAMIEASSIHINYRCTEGWWYATSEQLDGLLVAHQDLDVVKSEVPLVIRALLQAQYGEQ